MTRQTAEMKRKTLLDQLASDPELAKFVIETPEELLDIDKLVGDE